MNEEIEPELIKPFINKRVTLEINTIGVPFFLVGIIREVKETAILFETDRLGLIRIIDIVRITERD